MMRVRAVTINGTEHPIAATGNTTISVTDSTGQIIGTLVINAEGDCLSSRLPNQASITATAPWYSR